MAEVHSQLLTCPNPWCKASQPCLVHGRDRRNRVDEIHVVCLGCRTVGSVEATVAAAVAGWNTRNDPDGGETRGGAWRDAAQPAPEGEPVMALYRAFNRPDGRWMKHVVWWRGGGWRVYPFTANKGFVERWQPLGAH